jgi:hypothetical protein
MGNISKEYIKWLENEQWDLIGTMGFHKRTGKGSGRLQIVDCFNKVNDRKYNYRIEGVWLGEISSNKILHYHFVSKLISNNKSINKNGALNDIKNRMFNYWRNKGSCHLAVYDGNKGNWVSYIFKDVDENDFEYDLI